MRIKGILVLLVWMSGFTYSSQSQVLEPVTWSFGFEEVEEGVYDVLATASIEEQWHIYALSISDDENIFGPIPTSLGFAPGNGFSVLGEAIEKTPFVTHYDPNFELDLNFFENEAVFARRIKITNSGLARINGEINYMACDESKCIFPDPVSFKISVSGGKMTGISAYNPVEEALAETAVQSAPQSGIHDPVKWTFAAEKLSDKQYKLTAQAQIESGWHIYSQHLSNNDGPLPTVFTWKGAGVVLIDSTLEPSPHVEYDPNFMMNLAYFEGNPEFEQIIELTDGQTSNIEASVDFMVCNAEMCLPPELREFEIDLTSGSGKTKDQNTTGLQRLEEKLKLQNVDAEHPQNDCGAPEKTDAEKEEQTNLWTVFLLGFGGGFIALLTPCVFPMIPLTVSFFTKGSENRKKGLFRAILYGFFIFFIYFAISLPFHIWKIDPDVFNSIATGVNMNLAFFAVFIIFAVSFFGYFELTLPQSWANKADGASMGGGILGIFFMAMTLVVVSFSCTGPILGSMLAQTLSEGPMPLTVVMSGFGVALGLPFALFAMFPSWLNNLPKSGGWLNSVKVVLGFAEVALAIKFLSNADLVVQWGLVHRETFFLIWMIISFLIGIYLFGKIRFPHDSPLQKLSKFRVALAIVFIGFGVYLAPGIMKNPTWDHGMLAGFPPPKFYSWYEQESKCPLNLDCVKDINEAFSKAEKSGKPIFVDFTGWACVNCRRMEENVWVDPEVYKLLSEEFEVVSLYVDDKRPLDEEHQGVVEFKYADGETKLKAIQTIGDRWSAMEILSLNNSAQPYYAVISPDGYLMTPPVGYTPDEKQYARWLQCGLDTYNEFKSEK